MNSPYVISLEDRVMVLTNDVYVMREALAADVERTAPLPLETSVSDCLGTLGVNLYILCNEIAKLRSEIDSARG